MKKSISLFFLLCLTQLTGCFLEDLSNVEAITATGSVSINDNFGIIGNQIIERRGNFWIKGPQLPVKNSSYSGESVHIKDNLAIIADAYNRQVNIFKYHEINQTWEHKTHLVEPYLSSFGESVYINKDIAVIGAPGSNTVTIYTPVDEQWQEHARISSDTISFGSSVDISDNFIFIGANAVDKVYIYRRSETGIEIAQTIDHFDETGSNGGKQFGWSLDAHGNQLAIAAYTDWSNPEKTKQGGQVHIYQLKDQQWEWLQAVGAFDDSQGNPSINGKYFGHNLEMNDGNLMVGDDGLDRIFHFVKNTNGLWEPEKSIPTNNQNNGFGYHLSINTHFLLTGGFSPTLYGPQAIKANLKGRVIDANGFPIYRATINGMLADQYTNEKGYFSHDLPFGWSGDLNANYYDVVSNTANVNALIEDTELSDFRLNTVPEYLISGYIGTSETISIKISGFEAPIQSFKYHFWVTLPNGWSGEIRPVSDHLKFKPEVFIIEELNGRNQADDIQFNVYEKQSPSVF